MCRGAITGATNTLASASRTVPWIRVEAMVPPTITAFVDEEDNMALDSALHGSNQL